MYIYKADVYCDECGCAIMSDLDSLIIKGELFSVDVLNESSYDSDDYPKYVDEVDDSSDTPQHCANAERCLCNVTLPSGRKIGKLLHTNLTPDGINYVLGVIKYKSSEVTDYWYTAFTEAGYDFD